MDFLTTTEAAKELKISRSRIYQLIAEKKLPAEKIGRDFVIRRAALQGVRVFGKPGRPVREKKS